MRRAAFAILATLAYTCGDHAAHSAVRLGDTVPILPTSERIESDGTLNSRAITEAMIRFGDSIFHGGETGGSCATCHGIEGQGSEQAPALDDDVWLNGDGSYDWIARIIRQGVAPPRVYPVAMPPDGGESLTRDEARAVAAYVYSLRNRDS